MEPAIDVPIVCRQCAKPPCVEACPVDAFIRDAKTGVLLISEELCIGCGACAEKCPFHAITMHPDKDIAIKCDLCGGDPACVKFCPGKVLRYTSTNLAVQCGQFAWVKSTSMEDI
ncbi:MAG: 4Fe-4S dicluster domain-containing protein [Candidatus Bathyarchaeia archaeon]